MLSIIVLNYNRLQYTKRTIERLIETTKIDHEFIFVDNGSIDGTREYLESLCNKTNAKKVTCIFNPSNYGVAGGRNEGLHVAQGDYLMTIDDDILVPNDYDNMLVSALDSIEKLGIVGINVEKKSFKFKNINGINLDVKQGNLGGACLCMTRKTFEKIGYFSPDFVYGGEDCDMHVRITRLGLFNAYIIPRGEHIDENSDPSYVALKKEMHSPHSKPYMRVGANEISYSKRGTVYVPYRKPNIDTERFDKIIKGK